MIGKPEASGVVPQVAPQHEGRKFGALRLRAYNADKMDQYRKNSEP